MLYLFFFTDTATTEIYTLSLHDALPISSKWNKIEHRLFSFISTNWRGKPLISHEVIINLITGTTTTTGLKVYAQLDDREYEKGVAVSDEQLAEVKITPNTFHGDWNYQILPSLAKS